MSNTREITFRAKIKNAKNFAYGSNMEGIGNFDLKTFFKAIATGHLIENTLSEYTGFKYKNKIEIFEGDILNHCFMDSCPNKKGIVKNVNGCWMIKAAGTNKYRPLCNIDGWVSLEDYPYDLEVIGNIYENPELITN